MRYHGELPKLGTLVYQALVSLWKSMEWYLALQMVYSMVSIIVRMQVPSVKEANVRSRVAEYASHI